MQQILASHQVTLEIKEISYDQWHEGEIESDIWLNSANFTLPLDFSLFAHLCEVPLLQHCIPNRLASRRRPLAQWRNEPGELVPATGRQ
ncbi:putative substrate-binding protein [Escherichia coli]|uniref:Putative substrate-binding protein n=1 Tax=Escherichia coli TaxID=562 RepID=A0A376TL43_ECOLX|nr:putative substrate-binding protein [Escherichia coli]